MSDQDKRSEDLMANNVVLSDNVALKHVGKEINRIVKIQNDENKPYYFLTETLEPRSVRCNAMKKTTKDGKDYTMYSFSLKGDKKPDPVNESDPDKEMIESSESQNIITRLNVFKRGITDRIRYRMMIPQYPEQKSYILTLKTIKLDDRVKFSNILEYKKLKNNFGFRTVSNILSTCRYKLLFRIESVTLTHSNVFLDTTLVRIFPESLESLESNDKLYILNELNAVTVKNINQYNELNRFTRKQRSSKDQVRLELKKILSIC